MANGYPVSVASQQSGAVRRNIQLSPSVMLFFTLFGAFCVAVSVIASNLLHQKNQHDLTRAHELNQAAMLADALTPFATREIYAERYWDLLQGMRNILQRHPQVEDAVVISQDGEIRFDLKERTEGSRSWRFKKDPALLYVERPLILQIGGVLSLEPQNIQQGKLMLGIRPMPEPSQARQFEAISVYSRTLAWMVSRDLQAGQFVELGNLVQNLVLNQKNILFTQLLLPDATVIAQAHKGVPRSEETKFEGKRVQDPTALSALASLKAPGTIVKRHTDEKGRSYLAITVALGTQGKFLGALRIGYLDEDNRIAERQQQIKFGLIAGAAVLGGLLLATWVSWRMARLLGALDVSRKETGDLYEEKRAELLKAQGVQKCLLGDIQGAHGPFLLNCFYQPASELCGDFFDIAGTGPVRIIFLADVSGHGAASAMVTATLKSLFRMIAKEALRTNSLIPSDILRRLDEGMREAIPESHFYATGILMILDLERVEITICTAGHPPAMLFRAGRLQPVDMRGLGPLNLLDLFEDDVPVTNLTLQMQPGDKLLLFTDGLTEVHDPNGREFTERGVAEVVESHWAMTGFDLLEKLHNTTVKFASHIGLDDDQAMILLEVQAVAAQGALPPAQTASVSL